MLESLLALIAATILLLGSPGPVPLALAANGATFGIRRGLSFLLGILLGLVVVIIGAASGIAALFASQPEARWFIQIFGALYMCYVAYRIATAPVLTGSDSTDAKPPGMLDGFILNLLNPKAYAAFLAIFSQFLLPFDNITVSLIVTGVVCWLIAIVVDVIWLCLGGVLRPIFEQPRQARIMRVSFAILMVVAVLIALMG